MLLKLFLIFSLFISVADAQGFVVLIDPGHGGKELGAVAKLRLKNSKGKLYKKSIFEKDLTLELAKRVKRHLDKKFSTYLTRSFDRTVSLEDRAGLADTVKADLFISLHFNSSTDHSSHGFETYYLDNHNDVAIKKVETIENKGLEGENKIINQILIDLAIQKTVPSSKKLARAVHRHVASGPIVKRYKRRDRGMKPGLFYVLALSKRPGVLVEAGFISNEKEVFKLKNKSYLEAYAKAIAKGVTEFHASLPRKEVPLF